MPRALVIGNGRILANFDNQLVLRDLYYPKIGLINHITGQRNAMGIWADGQFAWIYEDGWQRKLGYRQDTLVTEASARHWRMGLELHINDAVHYCQNIIVKRVRIRNLKDQPRDVRVFLVHDLSINESDIGDTALYDPTAQTMMHYKRDRAFLIGGRGSGGGIAQFATGTKRFGGAEGTWRDAEDGRLEGNPIAQGSVDSTIAFHLHLDPYEEGYVDYWMAMGGDFNEVRSLHNLVSSEGVPSLLRKTEVYWQSWVNKYQWDFGNLPAEVYPFYKRSLLTVRTQIDDDGAIIAANDTDILATNRDHYSYMWPRDGALVAYALDKAGYPEITERFFAFCKRALTTGGFLWHKYHADGSVGSSWHPWVRAGRAQLPIQEDETALVLFALWHYYQHERNLEVVEHLYEPLVRPAADFLLKYRDVRTGLPLESFDLWEERRGVFTFTTAAVYAGLRAASKFAGLFGDFHLADTYQTAAAEIKQRMLLYLYDEDVGRFLRGFYMGEEGKIVKDMTLESSLYAITEFRVFDPNDPKVVRTMEAVENGLWVKTRIGGTARYTNDYYFRQSDDVAQVPGNPWIICSLWVAEWYIDRARSREELMRAAELIDWAMKGASEAGMLPEQLNPLTGEPVSVSPLTWSHATFVLTVLKYVESWRKINDLPSARR